MTRNRFSPALAELALFSLRKTCAKMFASTLDVTDLQYRDYEQEALDHLHRIVRYAEHDIAFSHIDVWANIVRSHSISLFEAGVAAAVSYQSTIPSNVILLDGDQEKAILRWECLVRTQARVEVTTALTTLFMAGENGWHKMVEAITLGPKLPNTSPISQTWTTMVAIAMNADPALRRAILLYLERMVQRGNVDLDEAVESAFETSNPLPLALLLRWYPSAAAVVARHPNRPLQDQGLDCGGLASRVSSAHGQMLVYCWTWNGVDLAYPGLDGIENRLQAALNNK